MEIKNYEKIYIDGTQEFSLFSFTTRDTNRIIPLHYHQELEVIYCLSGKMKIWLEGKTIILEPNHFFVINSMVPHSTQSHESGTFVVLYFRPNLFLDQATRIHIEEMNRKQASYQQALGLIHQIFVSTTETDPYLVFHQRSLLNEFIYLLLKYFSTKEISSKRLMNRTNKVQKIIELMQENYTTQLSLEDLARLSGYTPTYLSRMLKENTGQTFSEYKRSLCIEHAIHMIESQDDTLELIANKSGFANEKSLRTAFKEVMQMTPREYIKRQKDKK